MSDLVERLHGYAEDPMWDAHAEVPKPLIVEAAARIEALEAIPDLREECANLQHMKAVHEERIAELEAEVERLNGVLDGYVERQR